MSNYRVVRLIGSSSTSWQEAAKELSKRRRNI